MHEAVYKELEGAEKLIVFIHGFMGSPDQFLYLADAVYNRGCSYLSILLPGHGVSSREFSKFGARDWQQHVQSELLKVRDRYSKIYLVGHSMGGLISLNASLLTDNKIAGVFLLSTPLKINYTAQSIKLRLKLLLYKKDHKVKSAYLKATSIINSGSFINPLYLKPLIHFYKLVGITKKNLEEVFVPVCIVHSKYDETTSFKSSALLYEGLSNTKRTVIKLQNSWHAFFTDDEREVICNALLDFII